MPANLKLQLQPAADQSCAAAAAPPAVPDKRDPHYTLALAQLACEQIKALSLPADPPSFELWYAYAGNHNPALNQAINERLKQGGRLSVADADRLYERFLSPLVAIDSLNNTGNKIGDEVRALVAMIELAVCSADEYQDNLNDATRKLDNGVDGDALRAIVTSLCAATAKAARENGELQSRLKISLQEIGYLQKDLEAARAQSLTDPLTRLGNRMCFDQSLEAAVAAAQKRGEPVSLLLGDIDHFKKFNDSYGHLVGDDVLRLVARALKNAIKGQDIAARYGGEEFAVILPNTGAVQARIVAENIRSAVRAKELVKRSTGASLGRITISIGAAAWRDGEAPQALIERADKCLYMAKRDGRDRVVAETDVESWVV